MTGDPGRRPWYWERYVDDDSGWRGGKPPPGEELAALRQGAGREPGTVPAMWRFLTVSADTERLDPRTDAWEPHPRVVAEHHALVLFGIHQQSKDRSMHRAGRGVAASIGALSVEFSQAAVDRRFAAAVTSVGVDELGHHLRSLVRLLRGLDGRGAFDYGRLVGDLERWAWPPRQPAIRRRWGLEYERAELSQSEANLAGDPAADSEEAV